MAKQVLGIDVSSYNGEIDWKQVKAAGCEFAIIKIIRKDLNPDKRFEANWNGCVAAGITIQGVYNYTYATNAEKAKRDAERVLEVLNGRHTMVWLDYEDASLPRDRTAADIINSYGDVITAAGCHFGVYFGMSYYSSYLDKIMPWVKQPYKIGWEARYYLGYKEMTLKSDVNQKYIPNNFNGQLYGWQYSSSGKVKGIAGPVDLNCWYVDAEACNLQSHNSNSHEYTLNDFLLESANVWKTSSKAEMLKRTVTVSTSTNKNHEIVTALERYMKSIGLYNGSIEADAGKKPIFGNGMKKAIMLYQESVVKAKKKYQDGILTARSSTWKKLYS